MKHCRPVSACLTGPLTDWSECVANGGCKIVCWIEVVQRWKDGPTF